MIAPFIPVSLGSHIVAPSDMMDGRIGAIKEELRRCNLMSKVSGGQWWGIIYSNPILIEEKNTARRNHMQVVSLRFHHYKVLAFFA